MLPRNTVLFLLVVGLFGCTGNSPGPGPATLPATQAPEQTAFPSTTTPIPPTDPPEPTETAEPTHTPTATPSHPWTILARMPTPRSEMSAVYLEGHIYVPGGFGNNFRQEDERAFEVYDIAGGKWTRLADIPLDRANHHAAAVHGGLIYLFSDWDGGRTLRYDPATDEWAARTPSPQPRYAGAAVTWEGFIYLVGGVGSGNTNAVQRYDPAADRWVLLAAHDQRREHVAAAVLDGEIYLLGGRLSREFNTVEIYDIAEDRWRNGSPMLENRAGFGAAAIGGRIYVAGGELISLNRTLDSVDYFDAQTGQWRQANFLLPYPLHGLPLVTDGIHLFAVGGSDAVGTVGNRGELFRLEPAKE